jgi:hypothetical protein
LPRSRAALSGRREARLGGRLIDGGDRWHAALLIGGNGIDRAERAFRLGWTLASSAALARHFRGRSSSVRACRGSRFGLPGFRRVGGQARRRFLCGRGGLTCRLSGRRGARPGGRLIDGGDRRHAALLIRGNGIDRAERAFRLGWTLASSAALA